MLHKQGGQGELSMHGNWFPFSWMSQVPGCWPAACTIACHGAQMHCCTHLRLQHHRVTQRRLRCSRRGRRRRQLPNRADREAPHPRRCARLAMPTMAAAAAAQQMPSAGRALRLAQATATRLLNNWHRRVLLLSLPMIALPSAINRLPGRECRACCWSTALPRLHLHWPLLLLLPASSRLPSGQLQASPWGTALQALLPHMLPATAAGGPAAMACLGARCGHEQIGDAEQDLVVHNASRAGGLGPAGRALRGLRLRRWWRRMPQLLAPQLLARGWLVLLLPPGQRSH